jgi:hypothetical protein
MRNKALDTEPRIGRFFNGIFTCRGPVNAVVRREEAKLERFRLKPIHLWGDYGDVLAGGYYHRNDAGLLLLHRAGPFLPPISFPWGLEGSLVVVSDEFRREIQEANFIGVQFREVIKERIVPLDWDTWDRSAESPRHSPPNGEPEAYIWDKPHDPVAANKMPPAWEFLAPLFAVEYEEIPELKHELVPPLRAILPRRVYPPWFRTRIEYGDQVLAAESRAWMQRSVGEWVVFEPLHWRYAEPDVGADSR